MPALGWSIGTHNHCEGNDLALWSTVLVLGDQSGLAVAIADLDIGVITDEQAQVLRTGIASELGIDMASVRVSATHNHAGPVTTRFAGAWIRENAHLVSHYVDDVIAKTVGAAWEAAQRLQPVRIGKATGSSPLAINRRAVGPDGRAMVGLNPDGPVDHTVRVARLDGEDGPVAIIVHYSAHPIILGPGNALVTPEYPGIVKRVVEEAHGGACIFLQGTCGDVGPTEIFCDQLEPYRRLGAMLGHESAAIAYRAKPGLTPQRPRAAQDEEAWIAMYEYEPAPPEDTTIGVARGTAMMPLRRDLGDPDALDTEAARLEDELYEAVAKSDEHAVRNLTARTKMTTMHAERARALAGLDHYPMEVQGIRIGSLALLGTPIEPFIELGMAVARDSPFPMTMVSGYSNGYRNYLPTAAEYSRGGYEVGITPYTPDAPQVYLDTHRQVLSELTRS